LLVTDSRLGICRTSTVKSWGTIEGLSLVPFYRVPIIDQLRSVLNDYTQPGIGLYCVFCGFYSG